MVSYTERNDITRLIGARELTPAERKSMKKENEQKMQQEETDLNDELVVPEKCSAQAAA
jgi:hypothetical protein